MIKKTTALKKMIQSSELSFLMEAHNGISARIVEEAGFQGIWGSGLSLSASLGVRDNNEASWTQILEMVEFMSDATTIPILLDGDTGYGNFNNMRRLVMKLEQREIAGVCIEDKLFPKTNSFLRGEQQPLADIDEFCGKIKAGLDARRDDDFCIIARVEAFIAGWGLKEALKRAEAYRQAGATAILMHSKINKPDEIFEFTREWGNRCPVVIVPTKYYTTPTEEFAKEKISTVIWANHLLRSAISAMKQTASEIYNSQSLISVENKIVSVSEVFRLQNDNELALAESKYLPNSSRPSSILLAASRGKELKDLTINKPKALLNVNGKPLIQDTIEKLKDQGIANISIVRGYKKECFPDFGCTYIDNDDFDSTGEIYSLMCAKDQMQGEIIIGYGDVMFKKHLLTSLCESKEDISLLVDSSIANRASDYIGDFVHCSRQDVSFTEAEPNQLLKMSLGTKGELDFTPFGEWIGLIKVTPKGAETLRQALDELAKQKDFKNLKMNDLFTHLIQKDTPVGITYVRGHWMDIDHYQDFDSIQVF